ncbi:MAG: hypothetical protein NDI61_05435 [Bdellovibrionaceae bacterium]|nr:hypothetical protein [Pseudobdellovibrionaceae bacterium]
MKKLAVIALGLMVIAQSGVAAEKKASLDVQPNPIILTAAKKALSCFENRRISDTTFVAYDEISKKGMISDLLTMEISKNINQAKDCKGVALILESVVAAKTL